MVYSHFWLLQRRKNKTSGTRLVENQFASTNWRSNQIYFLYLYKKRVLMIPEFLIYLCFGCWEYQYLNKSMHQYYNFLFMYS